MHNVLLTLCILRLNYVLKWGLKCGSKAHSCEPALICQSYSQYELKHSTLPTNACSKLESKTSYSCAKWTLPWICSTATKNKIEQHQLISFCSICYRLWILSVHHSRHLLAQSQQWKLQKYVRNLLKVNNKDTRTTSLGSLWCFYC